MRQLHHSRRRALGVVLAGYACSVLAVGGCSSFSPATRLPAASGTFGLDWEKTAVDAGAGNPLQTIPPYEGPGSLGHPGAYQGGQANLLDVTVAAGRLVAIGYLARDIVADAWTSGDGISWERDADFPAAPGSLAVSVAGGAGAVVAVGRAGTSAAAWWSADGLTWQAAQGDDFADPAELQMTAIAALPAGGFVAGGWAGALRGPIRAAFWTSPDGAGWKRVPDDQGFDDARVTALAADPDGRLMAVGISGDAQTATGSAVWTSNDGGAWTRVRAPAMDGAPNGLTRAGGLGWVAVGTNLDRTRAMAWRSSDGLTWEAAPDAPALDNSGLKIDVRDVTWTGASLVAAGHRLFGTQYPTADVWLSNDGLAWTRANEGAALSQGRIMGVCVGGPGLVAVGDYGAPDFYVPTVWWSPPVPS